MTKSENADTTIALIIMQDHGSPCPLMLCTTHHQPLLAYEFTHCCHIRWLEKPPFGFAACCSRRPDHGQRMSEANGEPSSAPYRLVCPMGNLLRVGRVMQHGFIRIRQG